MTLFQFTVQDETGSIEKGERTARDKYSLAADLKSEGKTIITIDEKTGGSFNIAAFEAKISRVSQQEKILFANNLSAMIEAGLPMARALSVLERQSKNPKFKQIMQTVSQGINKGKTLSESLAEYPDTFSSLMISMVKVGEETGNLAESLEVIGAQLEKSYMLKKKVKGAMMYPSIVITVMIIIAALMLTYVVPTLTQVFKEMEVDLPGTTQFIIFISDAMAAHALLIFGGTLIIIALLISYARTTIGKRTFEFLILHSPVIGNIVKMYNTAQTTRTLSSLLSAGVGVVDALIITRDVVQNSYYKDVLSDAMDDVQKGVPFSKSFEQNEKLYPILAAAMVEVGEETGKLSEMMLKTAEFYETEVNNITKDLTTIIEPILMVVIGGGVGFFAVSMITPMYSLTTVI